MALGAGGREGGERKGGEGEREGERGGSDGDRWIDG